MSVIAGYARGNLAANGDAKCYQDNPSKWKIDESQEKLIEQWAKAARLWMEKSDEILTSALDPMMAQRADAKVYYRESDTSVAK